jgi:hypothetical protein
LSIATLIFKHLKANIRLYFLHTKPYTPTEQRIIEVEDSTVNTKPYTPTEQRILEVEDSTVVAQILTQRALL